MKAMKLFLLGLSCLALQLSAQAVQAGPGLHCDPWLTDHPKDPPPEPVGDFTSNPGIPPVPNTQGAYGPCGEPQPSPSPEPTPPVSPSPEPSEPPKDQTPGDPDPGSTVPPVVSLLEGSGKFGCTLGASGADFGSLATLLPLAMTLPWALRRRRKSQA